VVGADITRGGVNAFPGPEYGDLNAAIEKVEAGVSGGCHRENPSNNTKCLIELGASYDADVTAGSRLKQKPADLPTQLRRRPLNVNLPSH
jgi:hypothetical protein